MKHLFILIVLFISATCSVFAQEEDYSTYDVIAKRNKVVIVVKNNAYRMIVGSLNKPKTVFLLGNYKDQAERQIERLLETVDRCSKNQEKRTLLFCGVNVVIFPKESGSRLKYKIQRDDNKVRFPITKDDLTALRQSFIDYHADENQIEL